VAILPKGPTKAFYFNALSGLIQTLILKLPEPASKSIVCLSGKKVLRLFWD
jgi:hypothetical protein